uniref:uncharacterized protein LOC122608589 n=1 Tax=Erigeron canadensis TaxID=72917 RepID=UPI001CB91D73|nr:uncharacterized protein LOC122608589 [Erigeron canadensis]
MATPEYQIIHHPSHPHPLVPLSEPILRKCDACGEKHEGIFYLCTTCFGLYIHRSCAFLPKKLLIQEVTNNNFSHRHPLTISYSFPWAEQKDNLRPRCRVCDRFHYDENSWILKCEKCRYFAHLSCATSGRDSLGNKRIIPNFKDSDYPDLVRLPFPTASDSILKHLFSNQVIGCENFKMEDAGNPKPYNCHPHPLILVRTESGAMPSSSSTTILLSCLHDPMKKIELLCNGCLRPITNMPFYKCADKCDNFVLHEWCTRLPDKLENQWDHPAPHTLFLQPSASNKFFSVFVCAICQLPCNGFVYTCVQCDYHIDVKCAFLSEKITHDAHPGHLMSRVKRVYDNAVCHVCRITYNYDQSEFHCDTCSDVWVHTSCAMLLPGEIRHKYDKHPMRICYTPVENHKSQYFCEICEEEFDPEVSFYHCYQCAQSIHTHCAPLILQSERAQCLYGWSGVYEITHNEFYTRPNLGVFLFVNIKFGGILQTKMVFKDHPHHPLIFDQGIHSDGTCNKCGEILQNKMIFKCQQCTYAIDLDCCENLTKHRSAN